MVVVHGQPNIYALFMAATAALLRKGGEFLFITPRSFASGPYFRLFREKFFANIRPVGVHVFGSRREAFGRDEVLQESIGLRRPAFGQAPFLHALSKEGHQWVCMLAGLRAVLNRVEIGRNGLGLRRSAGSA